MHKLLVILFIVNVWVLLWLSKTKIWWKSKIDNDSFIVYINDSSIAYLKTDDIYKQTAEDKIKNEKSNWINERWIRWKNHDKTYSIKSKNYSYLMNDSSEDKRAKTQKKCAIKRKFKFVNYKKLLRSNSTW